MLLPPDAFLDAVYTAAKSVEKEFSNRDLPKNTKR
jgi:hypothetical protein